MQLSMVTPNSATTRTSHEAPFDAISPRQLFAAASVNIEHALDLLEESPSGKLPTIRATNIALLAARRGAQLLSSVLVPTTPFLTAQQAMQSLDHLRAAIALVSYYRHEYAPAAVANPCGVALDPTGSARATLDAARDRLVAAAARLV